MDIKKVKNNKKTHLTNEVANNLTMEVEEVLRVKDNVLLLKTQLNGHIVYYKVVISEVMKNIEDWLDLVEEYKEKKGGKK